ncbi:hypothetical protein BD413DRAFT_522149 [Trametes elegans]|nr:hypothetical protein BD413DRAFT_522149 [Trametes elegans]
MSRTQAFPQSTSIWPYQIAVSSLPLVPRLRSSWQVRDGTHRRHISAQHSVSQGTAFSSLDNCQSTHASKVKYAGQPHGVHHSTTVLDTTRSTLHTTLRRPYAPYVRDPQPWTTSTTNRSFSYRSRHPKHSPIYIRLLACPAHPSPGSRLRRPLTRNTWTGTQRTPGAPSPDPEHRPVSSSLSPIVSTSVLPCPHVELTAVSPPIV